jgi:hypothetical protein
VEVGPLVGVEVGSVVGVEVGSVVGVEVGPLVGVEVGSVVGVLDGSFVGVPVGSFVGERDGDGVGFGPPFPLPACRLKSCPDESMRLHLDIKWSRLHQASNIKHELTVLSIFLISISTLLASVALPIRQSAKIKK